MGDNISMNKSTNPLIDRENAAARERCEQAMVGADIEDAPRSPEIEATIAEWEAKGIDDEERIRRLKALFAEKSAEI